VVEAAIAALSWVITIVSLALTVYYGQKSSRLERQKKKLEWADLQAAATDMGRKIKASFTPVAILTPGLRGATFANLLQNEFSRQVPVFVGVSTWKEDPHAPLPESDSIAIETQRWEVAIPLAASRFPDGDILLLDDFVMSGDFMERLKKELVNAGVASERIHSAAVVVTKVAMKNRKAPDFYWMVAEDDDFFFPWGKAR